MQAEAIEKDIDVRAERRKEKVFLTTGTLYALATLQALAIGTDLLSFFRDTIEVYGLIMIGFYIANFLYDDLGQQLVELSIRHRHSVASAIKTGLDGFLRRLAQ